MQHALINEPITQKIKTIKKIFTPVFIILSQFIVFFSEAQIQINKAETIMSKLEKTTAPLKSYESFFKTPPVNYKQEIRGEEKTGIDNKIYSPVQEDPVIQPSGANKNSRVVSPESIIKKSWDGGIPTNGLGASVSPPSPSLAAGPNYVVQLINAPGGAFLNIWNKTGTPLVTNVLLSTLHSVAGADGSAIALYDKLADRWLLTEHTNFPTSPHKLVILMSKTNNPAGEYYVYSYDFGTIFPDYPKYAVWPNAYYCSTNNFSQQGSPLNSSIIAFDRAKMLAGDPTASLVKFDFFDNLNFRKYISMCVTTYQGGLSPNAGDPGMFIYLSADEFTSITTDVDSVGIISFNPNFSNPALSTYSIQSFATAPYNSQVGSGGAIIPQPGTSIRLQPYDSRIMNQPVYRDFGTHKSVFACHTVGITGNIAAIRWYEMRNTGSGYNLYQQGTYSGDNINPPDNTYRFMPSISVNKNDEMAIAYMVSSSNIFPGLRFAGRKADDPLGSLTSYPETSIIDGTASAINTADSHAGDYSHLQVDPVDDTTFWFTGSYRKLPALFGGYTRIAQFDLSLSSAPLPVILIAFTGEKKESTVLLSWETAQEINFQKFIVEKSNDGISFYEIASIAAANISTGKKYELTDNNLSSINYYRLKMVDIDGKFNYSEVIKINFGNKTEIRVSPNPASAMLTIHFNNVQPSKMLLQLVDMNGRIIKEESINTNTTKLFSLNGIAKGLYYLKLIDGKEVITKKIIVQ
jgi:Secretion system C-terminal sorting domain